MLYDEMDSESTVLRKFIQTINMSQQCLIENSAAD